MYTRDSIDSSRLNTVLAELLEVLHSAWNDDIDIAQAIYLDVAPQSIVQVDIWLNAIYSVDLGDLVTGKLIAATRTDFDNCAIGFCDKFWEIRL